MAAVYLMQMHEQQKKGYVKWCRII